MASWFRRPMLSVEYSGMADRAWNMLAPPTSLAVRRARDLATQPALEVGDHGGDRRVGVLAGVVDRPARRGQHDVGQAPQPGDPIVEDDAHARAQQRPDLAPAPRRRPTARSPRRRSSADSGEPVAAGFGTVATSSRFSGFRAGPATRPAPASAVPGSGRTAASS